jgi:hypothetical protein
VLNAQITNTVPSEGAKVETSFTKLEAKTMVHPDEKPATLTFDEVRKAQAADFAALRAEIRGTARQQTWRFIMYVAAIAAMAVGIVALMTHN